MIRALAAMAGFALAAVIFSGCAPSRHDAAVAVCAKAQREHRLVYPMQRCVAAETENLEDY